MKDVLNLSETAEYLRVSNQTVYNMIHDKRIKAHKVGREWRFLREDVAAYLDSNSTGDRDVVKGGYRRTKMMNKWLIVEEENNVDASGKPRKHAECPNCGFTWSDLYSVKNYFRFCPHCAERLEWPEASEKIECDERETWRLYKKQWDDGRCEYLYGPEWKAMELYMEGGYSTLEEAKAAWLREWNEA